MSSRYNNNSIEEGDSDSDEERFGLKRSLSEDEKIEEFLKTHEEGIPVKLRKTTHDEAPGEKGDTSDKDTNAEAKSLASEDLPPTFSYERVKAIMFDHPGPTITQAISCFESLRKILSESETPPTLDVIQSGLLTALVHGLSNENEKVRFETAWALASFTSGASEQTLAAVEAGATGPLVKLVLSDKPEVAHKALSALANIAGKSPQLRDCVIKWGGVEAMMRLVNRLDDMQTEHVQTLARAFSNICRHRSGDLEVLRKISTGICKLLQHKDEKVRQDSCWMLGCLTNSYDNEIELVLSGAVESLVALLGSSDDLALAALRTLCNIASGSDDLKQQMFDFEVLQVLSELSKRSTSPVIIMEICSFIAKIATGSYRIQQIIDAGFVGFIVNVLSSGEYTSQMNASSALSKLTEGGKAQIYTMVEEGAVTAMAKMLNAFMGSMIQDNLLDAICTCLFTISKSYPAKMNGVRESLESTAGIQYLRQVSYSSHKLSPRANKVIRLIMILLEP